VVFSLLSNPHHVFNILATNAQVTAADVSLRVGKVKPPGTPAREERLPILAFILNKAVIPVSRLTCSGIL
jgi:hypothetical protein